MSNKTGDERFKELGLTACKFYSPNRNVYILYWGSPNNAYYPEIDSFRMLQDTGRLGGVGVRIVKAETLKKSWQEITE